MTKRGGATTMLVVGILGAAFLLRAPLTSVPPALSSIRADLGLSPVMAGATTAVPLLCLGVFAFLTPLLIARWGLERTMFAAVVPITLGLLLRGTAGVAVFFVGAVLIGVGIAIGNVLVPALIRARFPLRMALLMGAYVAILQGSASLGSLLTAPLDIDAGLGWRVALGVWTVPAALVVLWWIVLVTRRGVPEEDIDPPTGMASVVRKRLTWAITVFMGFQSLMFYSLVTWMPAQFVAAGHSPSMAGMLLAVFSLLGLPGAFVAPHFAAGRYAGWFIIGVYAIQGVGILLLGGGLIGSAIAAVLCGLAQGTAFSAALTFVAGQPNAGDVPAVSAFAQGTGYILAAFGPPVLGGVYSATGGWETPNLILLAVTVLVAALGADTGRRLYRAHTALGR
ncbi:MAG: MFS transporter [Mobilicoccus sp.]|nr:MFS transporter [Mobilicoccus sp.]